MTEAPKQLTLELPLEPRFGREDFLVSPSNERAYALIERWPDWPDTILLLEGPQGQRQEPSRRDLGGAIARLDGRRLRGRD